LLPPLRDLAGRSLFDHAHDVALLRDDEILAIDFDLGTGPLPKQYSVADFDIERTELAVIVPPGPAAMTSPSIGFSLAVSGMIIPPAVFSSSSMRRINDPATVEISLDSSLCLEHLDCAVGSVRERSARG